MPTTKQKITPQISHLFCTSFIIFQPFNHHFNIKKYRVYIMWTCLIIMIDDPTLLSSQRSPNSKPQGQTTYYSSMKQRNNGKILQPHGYDRNKTFHCCYINPTKKHFVASISNFFDSVKSGRAGAHQKVVGFYKLLCNQNSTRNNMSLIPPFYRINSQSSYQLVNTN